MGKVGSTRERGGRKEGEEGEEGRGSEGEMRKGKEGNEMEIGTHRKEQNGDAGAGKLRTIAISVPHPKACT